MKRQNSNQCDLRLLKMVFDKIYFERSGFKNENELELEMNVQVSENKTDNLFKVTLGAEGIKAEEYKFEVKLTGFFSVDGDNIELKKSLINQNAVAILMPYIRSEISLLTAQPETDCVVLPPFNITKLMKA